MNVRRKEMHINNPIVQPFMDKKCMQCSIINIMFCNVVPQKSAYVPRGVFMWIRIAICDAMWANCESNVKLIRNFANQK